MTLDLKPRARYFATVKTQFWVKNSHFWVEMAIFGDFTYLIIRFLVKFAYFLDFFANKSFWNEKKFHLFFWVFWVDCTDTFSSKRIWPGADFERNSSRSDHPQLWFKHAFKPFCDWLPISESLSDWLRAAFCHHQFETPPYPTRLKNLRKFRKFLPMKKWGFEKKMFKNGLLKIER